MRKKSSAGKSHEILIVDPTGGLSGDMLLACLFALGVNPRDVEREIAGLPGLEPFRIVVGKVRRKGFSLWRARVRCGAAHSSRDLGSILAMIERSTLEHKVKELASAVFGALGRVEGAIHGVRPEKVHFHEVGAVDSIVDIVGVIVALSMLRFPRLYHRPFRLGEGTISIAHGTLPVPVPATLALLEGRTVTLGGVEGEVVTPTGAVLMRILAEELPADLSFVPRGVVYATGTREGEPGAGVLRMISVERCEIDREIIVVRTTIDDMNPELYGHVQEMLFNAGALEVYLTQIIMKKGRPGILVTILCNRADRGRIVRLLFDETTTLGVRVGSEWREELERWTEAVDTPFGSVQVKYGRLPDGTVKCAPEYESCRCTAAARKVRVADVYQAARAAARDAGARGTAPAGRRSGGRTRNTETAARKTTVRGARTTGGNLKGRPPSPGRGRKKERK
ncbi:MAG TPA: nickel pincer cofactor biosynthesis protein LarC [Patescibacteria group bacterium]|nr:nickel pincer cofactor biosynthesis protein LarC [Patescibacteria group bacterium]